MSYVPGQILTASALNASLAAYFPAGGVSSYSSGLLAQSTASSWLSALGLPTVSPGAANGLATLDGTGKLTAAQIPSGITGSLSYIGGWNASTNAPSLVSGTGTNGNYYVVSTAGTTSLDGIAVWNVGDWAIFNGTHWEKIDGATNVVTSVAGRTGAVALTAGDIAGVAGGMINKFRNGAFDIANRYNANTVGSGSSAYTLDGWIVTATGANQNWNQEYNANLAGNALRLNCATGLTVTQLYQRIEATFAASLLTAAKGLQPVTTQFFIYNGTSAAITPQIGGSYATTVNGFGTLTTDLSLVNAQTIAAGSSGIVSYTWTPTSANIANGYQVMLSFGSSLNAASGYVDIARADFRATPGLTTGVNNSPPAPELRNAMFEDLLCARYLPTFWSNGTALTVLSMAYVSGATIAQAYIAFRVPTLFVPSGITYSALAHFVAAVPSAGTATGLAYSVTTSNLIGSVQLTDTGASWTTGYAGQFRMVNSAGMIQFYGSEL